MQMDFFFASFVISMVTSKRTASTLKSSQRMFILASSCWNAAWPTVTVLLAGRTALLYSHKSSNRVKSQEKATINGIPTSKTLFQIHTDSSVAMCCSLSHYFFIHILISKYLLRKTCSMVTSLNPICSLRAGSREEACDKASSKWSSAHLNAGMKDDLAASIPAAHSCPVSCKGMLNWLL